jgi:hypothetical protein
MTQNTFNDRRVDNLKQRLCDELIDDHGQPPEPDDVERVVAAKAEPLLDAPVQEFVPLLIEHQARDELRQHGLRRELPEEETTDAVSDQTVDRTD